MSLTQDQLVEACEKVIVANELDNNLDFVYRFSDPDGVRSGKSGWSFGRSQFDTQNNKLALQCLRDCHFDETVIRGIVNQVIDVKPLNARLRANSAVIDRYDAIQIKSLVIQTQALAKKRNIALADDAALIAVADYANQYGMSDKMQPGYLVFFLANLGRPANAGDVLSFKLDHTKYGREHPDDCKRRYDNLIRIMGA